MYDFIVIGGGIVGMSTAMQLKQRKPAARILLLEKEQQVGTHQTGRNAGVIHAGIYYKPDSLKADFCKRGAVATMRFCKEHNVPYKQCGKLLVATDKDELERMEKLFSRCQQNDPATRLISEQQLRSMEPNILGKGAIYSPSTGIVDYRVVCEAMMSAFLDDGGEIQLGTQVTGIDEYEDYLSVTSRTKSFECRFLVACSGLFADRVADLVEIDTKFQLIPFRGEFYSIRPELAAGIRHLIYPIPDPALPFLGVHLTRRIDGQVIVGPNAVLSLKRDGYGKFAISLGDVAEMLMFPGFWKVIGQHLSTGLHEIQESWFKSVYVHRIQKYLPTITASDLVPFPAGIRAQPVTRDGRIIDDFIFARSARSLHVCNAPSPAATSAIPIGEHICEQLELAGN
jgi:L-2-hydroxyglutarate oxidase